MNKLLMVGLVVFVSCLAQSATFAQEQTKFKKENFSYNEWTKGKFSEVVTVTNPGKIIFLAGVSPSKTSL
jgi:2-iminobutanoate/2-iminopropanoate deaminase